MRFLAKIAADAYGSAALDELDSLFRDEGLDPRAAYARPPAGHDLRDDPFIVGDAPREVLLRVNARVVLTKEVYELWSDGPDLHACAHALAHSVPASVTAPRFAAAHSWRLNVVTHGHKLSVAEQESVRKHFAGTLRAEGPVRLKDDADVTYAAILDVLGVDDKGAVTTARRCKCPGPVAPTAPVAGEWRSAYACCGVTIERKLCEQASWVCAEGLRGEGERGVEESSTAGGVASSSSPSPSSSSSPRQSRVRRVFFGVAFPPCARRFVPELELRRRPYLGPTSLDAELALLMANLALCRPGHLSWDPFVGTGSITVAAAKLGATTFGSDIDSRVLVGKMGRNVGTNFDAYGLGMPELLRMDNSRPALRGWGGSGSGADSGIFDSIVTDPPYGVRAGARKSGKSAQLKERAERRRTEQGEGGEQVMEGAAEADAVAEAAAAAPAPESADSAKAPLPTTTTTTYLDGYSPSTTQLYDADEVMTDLLDVAARTLVLGGRLVYLFPTTIDTVYESLPAHPCLRRVHTSSEALSLVLVRLVVTMEKVAPYDPTQADAYRAAVRASAEAGGFTGGGVRARMGQLYEGWFAARKGSGAAGGGTGASSASSDPATAASAPRAPAPASGPGVIPEAHLESLTSKHSRKAESRMLFRQQRRIDRLAAADAAATADAAAGGAALQSSAAAVAVAGGAGGAGAGRPGKVRARSAAEGGQEEGEGLTRRDARLAAAARAAAEGAKLHIGNLPFDPPSGIMTETFRKARETIMGSLDGAAGGERGGK